MKKSVENPEYLEDLAEYQDKQYLPGYFTGGKFPLEYRYPTKRLGWFFLTVYIFPFLVFGLVILLVDGPSVFSGGNIQEYWPASLFLLFMLVVGLKLVIWGRKG